MVRLPFPVVLLMLLIIACNPGSERHSKAAVTVSILPLKYFAERICDGSVEVDVLVPPGSGPETYEPSPQEMIRMSKSAIFFKTGYYDIENLLSSKIREIDNTIEVVDLSRGMQMIREAGEEGNATHHGGIDPHVWSGISTTRVLIDNMVKALIVRFPEKREAFLANTAALLKDIDKLECEIKSKLIAAKRTTFVMYHPSLGYFARDFGLLQIALEAEGKSPSAAHMKLLIDRIRKEGIKTIFLQVQFDVHNTEAIAREINGKVVSVDPLEADWLGNMYRMTDKIVGALNE